MSSPQSYGQVSQDPKSLVKVAEEEDSMMKYVLGAILVAVLLVVINAFVCPSGSLKYSVVAVASLNDSESEALRTIRVSVELQTIMLIGGLVVAALFYVKRRDSIGLAVFGVMVVLAVGLIVGRGFASLHLNFFFGFLVLTYLMVAVLSVWEAISALRTNKRLVGILYALLGVFFLIGAFGAGTVAFNAITGDDAKALLVTAQLE
jgi:hypothetical protein